MPPSLSFPGSSHLTGSRPEESKLVTSQITSPQTPDRTLASPLKEYEVSIEEDAEYQALLRRGYKKEQASMIIKKKRSRQHMSPNSSLYQIPTDQPNSPASNAAPSTATSTNAATTEEKKQIHDNISASTNNSSTTENAQKLGSSNSSSPERPLTMVQERSIQNLMSAGMSRKDATLYVCSGSNSMSSILATLAKHHQEKQAQSPPQPRPLQMDETSSNSSSQVSAQTPATNAAPSTTERSPPTAVAMSVAAPVGSFNSYDAHHIAMTPPVHAEVIVDDDASGVVSSSGGSGIVDLGDVYGSVDGQPTQPYPSATSQQHQQHQLRPPLSQRPVSRVSNNDDDGEDEDEDEEALNERVQALIEAQREEFGLCMYDVLKMEDEAPMRRLIGEGYRPEDAVRLLFERKGYVSSKPLPQPRRRKPPQAKPPSQPSQPQMMMNPHINPSNMHFYQHQQHPPLSMSGYGMMMAPSPSTSIYHNSNPNAGFTPPPHPQVPPATTESIPPVESRGGNDTRQLHDERRQGSKDPSDGAHGNQQDESSSEGEDDNDDNDGDEEYSEADDEEYDEDSGPNRTANKTELRQYRLFSSKPKEGEEENHERRATGTFSSFLKKKTMRKMKVFLGLPLGDHHLKRDKSGIIKTEDERTIQKRLRYKDSDVQTITSMGFTKEQAVAALSTHKNRVNDAVNALLSEVNEPKQSTSKPAHYQASPPFPRHPQAYPPYSPGYPSPGYYPAPVPQPHLPAPPQYQQYPPAQPASQPYGYGYGYGYPASAPQPGVYLPQQLPPSGYYPGYDPNVGPGMPPPPDAPGYAHAPHPSYPGYY
jgi:hypothetical protein